MTAADLNCMGASSCRHALPQLLCCRASICGGNATFCTSYAQ